MKVNKKNKLLRYLINRSSQNRFKEWLRTLITQHGAITSPARTWVCINNRYKSILGIKAF